MDDLNIAREIEIHSNSVSKEISLRKHGDISENFNSLSELEQGKLSDTSREKGLADSEADDWAVDNEAEKGTDVFNPAEQVFPFICGFCNNRFTSLSYFLCHLQKHENMSGLFHLCGKHDDHNFKDDFHCSVCNSRFPSVCFLYEHLLNVEVVTEFFVKDRTAYIVEKTLLDKLTSVIHEFRKLNEQEHKNISSGNDGIGACKNPQILKNTGTQTGDSISENVVRESFREVKAEVSLNDMVEDYDGDTDSEYTCGISVGSTFTDLTEPVGKNNFSEFGTLSEDKDKCLDNKITDADELNLATTERDTTCTDIENNTCLVSDIAEVKPFKTSTRNSKQKKNGEIQTESREKRKGKCGKLNKHACSETKPQTQEISKQSACSICGDIFDSRKKLNIHKKLHMDKPFKCPVCNKGLTTELYKRLHMQKKHNIELHVDSSVDAAEEEVLHDRVKCPKCPLMFDSLTKMENHATKHSEDRKYECNICGQLYKTKSYLASHMNIHNDRKIPCSFCFKLFKSRKSVRAHERLQHINPVEKPTDTTCCEICGKEVKTQSMKSHLIIHGEPRFQCDMCDRVFHTRADARKHMKYVHTTKRDYVCELCGADFKCANSLKVHKREVHQAEYDHSCPKCSSVFKTKLRMETHLKVVHSTERPFVCSSCGKTFKRKSNLRVHQFSHSDNKFHKCSYCDKMFKLPADCKKHEKIHQPHTNFCKVCGKSFAFLYNLKCHEKLHLSK